MSLSQAVSGYLWVRIENPLQDGLAAVRIPAQQFNCCVTLGKIFDFSVLCFRLPTYNINILSTQLLSIFWINWVNVLEGLTTEPPTLSTMLVVAIISSLLLPPFKEENPASTK